MSPSDPQVRTITYDNAKLKIKPSAVKLPVGIGITPLAKNQVPQLDSGMTNVTAKPRAGYRFTPHPMQFAEAIEVSLPYDPALLNEAFTAQDIYTYFFDETGLCWQALPRVRVDEVEHLIVSMTDHFTDMINATVTVPEHPEGVNFNPNQIKGIQAADPGAGVNLIEPPSANNQGDNRLSYPIEVPPGRHGLQPQLAVNYDSGRGNGWMGLGWDINTQAITIDTRWGVPRYEIAQETETYLLNGEQLSALAHRGTLQARTAEKVFHSRIEGTFSKIVRHGNSPSTYTWEVTDRAGTHWFYGGSAQDTKLADAGGNIFVWPLLEARDANGNVMRYTYAKVDDTGIEGGAEPGRNLYLKRISYTGTASEEGKYTVTFVRDRELSEQLRVDKLIDARGGFKRVTADKLRKVEVAFDGNLVRRYELGYTIGAFHKTLLSSITQFDADGVQFNAHQFDYFDDIRDSQGRYQAFQNLPWTSPGDGLSKGELNLTPSQAGDASAINANTSFGGGGHLYVGVGTGASKSNSVGLKVGFSHHDDEGLLALVDVDGDNLADKVFKKNGIFYRKNQGGRFSDVATPLGLPAVMSESSNSLTLGIEGYLSAVAAQLDYVSTFATTSQYFSDVNGDSIMDMVTGSSVLFGRIGPNGTPVYGVSGDTPVPIGSGAVDPNGIFGDFAADRERLIDSFPLLDTVRRWVAPYDGVVNVNAPVRLAPETAAARAASKTADGVKVAIQLENTSLWTDQIGQLDNAVHTPTGVNAVNVTRGQRLYFRVQSIFDGGLDQVAWDPIITYTGQPDISDVNGLKEYRFQASTDFTLGGRSAEVKVPLTGTMHLEGDLTKRGATSDDITVLITAGGTPVLEQTLAGSAAGTVPVNLNVPVQQGQILKWRVKADSPIDLDQIVWTPRAFYTAAQGVDRVTDPSGNPLIDLFPPYDLDMYPSNDLTAPQGFHPVTADGTLSIEPSLTFDFGGQQINSRVVFTVKRRGALIAKRFFDIENGVVTSPAAFNVTVNDGDNLFFDFSTLDTKLRPFLTGQSVLVDGVGVANAFRSAAVEGAFPQPYRGWGAVGYNGNRGRADQPIVQTDLVIDENFGDQLPDSVDPQAQKDAFAADPRINPPKVTPFAPSPQLNRWGSGDNSWVNRTGASSSRLGTQSVYLPRPSDFASATAVPRLSRSQQISLTGSVGGPIGSIGGSIATGDSVGQMDFLDMNGDQFPDVVGAGGVQYSEMTGGLGAKKGPMPDGAVRKSTNIAGNASAGSAAKTITTGRGYASPPGHTQTNNADSGNDMPPLGVGGSMGENSGDSQFDLIDLNGDSLPDRIYSNGQVALNLGYRFGAPEPWRHPAPLNDGGGSTAGINIGFNTDFYGFAGGASYSEGGSSTDATLMDMNGDGLYDRVFTGQPMRVALNTGNGFEPPVDFHGSLSELNGEQNAKLGGGVYFTIPICFLVICIIINPGGDISTGASRTEFALRDINGDGNADHLASDQDNELTVAQNRTERTNMLRSVTRPLGARMAFDYKRDGNTYDQPQSRWVLSRVTVNDGQPGDGQDVHLSTYEYQGGVYDRFEREFFGYGTVVSQQRDVGAAEAVYRSITRNFRTDSHFAMGLMTLERTTDAAGNTFLETENQYVLEDVGGGAVFPQLTRTDKRFFEGQAQPGKSTHSTMEYDDFGNLTRFFDAADTGPGDDVDARVGFTSALPACQASNIIGTPRVIDVFGNGTLMRHRESTVDCTTGDVTQVRARLANGDTAITDLEYFGNGNLKAVIGPANEVNQRYRLDYTYENVVSTHVATITDSFGYLSSTTYNFKFGLVEDTTDFNNQVIRNTYDSVGRLDSVAGPYELPENRLTIDFEYHPEAAVPFAITRHVDRQANGSVSPNAIDTILFIDGLKRTTQTKKDASVFTGENTPPQESMVVSGRVIYDFLGRPVQQSYPVNEVKGALNTTFNPAFDSVPPTTVTFDVLDRPIRIVEPDNTATSTTHGFAPDRAGVTQFEQVVTDANGKSKRTYRDVRQLITATKEFNPGTIWTSFTHDPLSQLTSVTDDHNNVTTTAYDNFGRRTVMDSPDSGRTTTAYDLADNIVTKQTEKLAALGLSIEYDYEFKRLSRIRYPLFTANNVTYTYGAPGAANNGAGRIIGVVDGAGNVSRQFGPLGEVTQESRTSPAQGSHIQTFVTTYRYDTWNRMLQMTYPDGEVLSYHYNSGGQIDSATGVKGTFTYEYLRRLDYDKFDQRALLDTGNGTRTVFTYNAADRRLQNLNARLDTGYVFQNLQYDYDDVGNVTSISNNTLVPGGPDPGGPSTQNFRYDDLYRLVHADGSYETKGPKTDRYTYDLTYDSINNITRKTQVHEMVGSNGNPQTQLKTTYDYQYSYSAAQPHAASTIGIWTFAYDANGNQISRDQQPRPRRQMIWDEENRLACSHENVQSQTLPQTPASCDNAGGTPNNARYYYNDEGTRVVKDGSQFHMYPNENYSTRGNQEYKHVYIGQTKLVTKFVEPVHRIEDQQFYSHGDHLNSTGFITDDRGDLSEHLQYFPGGETWVSEHPSQPVPQQFTGKELDPETNLYYFGARYYDPRTQAWQTPDPALESYLGGTPNGGIFNSANLALYTYAYNNPVRLFDPTGAFPWNRVIGGVKLVGGVLEAAAGVAAGAATSWTGVGAVAGAAVAVHGVDVAISGARQLWTGEDTSSFTSSGLQAAGVSKEKADLIDSGVSIVGSLGAGALARAGTTTVKATTQATVQSGSPPALVAGRQAEAAHLASQGLVKLPASAIFRPTVEQIESAAFKVIVGPAKYTAGGKPIGVIPDAVALELKTGTSMLDSSYQLRLMAYRALVTGEKLTLRTTRPINPTFEAWLTRWGVTIEKIP